MTHHISQTQADIPSRICSDDVAVALLVFSSILPLAVDLATHTDANTHSDPLQ